jgi:hypothetical protein
VVAHFGSIVEEVLEVLGLCSEMNLVAVEGMFSLRAVPDRYIGQLVGIVVSVYSK